MIYIKSSYLKQVPQTIDEMTYQAKSFMQEQTILQRKAIDIGCSTLMIFQYSIHITKIMEDMRLISDLLIQYGHQENLIFYDSTYSYMVTYCISIVSIIDISRSSIKCIRSMYGRYGHNTFEMLSYYMVNNSDIWSYIRYIQLVLQTHYGHQLSIYGQYKGDMVTIQFKYYRIILSIIERFSHMFDTYDHYY